MSEFTPRLNYKEEGYEIKDEKFTVDSNNITYILKHHNVKSDSIRIYTQVDNQGTQITDVKIGEHHEKNWQTILTLGDSVAEGVYYVSYISKGDENDADDINKLQDEVVDFLKDKKGIKNVNSKSKGILLSDFTNSVAWYGSFEHSDERTMIGSTSGKLSTDDQNSTSALRLRNLEFKLPRINNFILRFYIEDISTFSKVDIRISDTDNMADYYEYIIRRYSGAVQGWNEVLIDVNKLQKVRNPSLELIRSIQLSVTRASGNENTTVHFDSLYFNHAKDTNIVIQFDDGWVTQYTNAFSIMKNYGIIGSVGIISDLVGTKNYMNLNQMKEMQNFGWEFFNHTKSHRNLSLLTKEEIKKELLECRDWLINNGFENSANYVAYPYGGYNDEVTDVMIENGFEYGRSVNFGFITNPPINPYGVVSVVVEDTHTTQEIKDYIDIAIETGVSLKLVFHKIEAVADENTTYTIDKFKEVIEYISSKNNLKIYNTFDWIVNGRQSLPRVI